MSYTYYYILKSCGANDHKFVFNIKIFNQSIKNFKKPNSQSSNPFFNQNLRGIFYLKVIQAVPSTAGSHTPTQQALK